MAGVSKSLAAGLAFAAVVGMAPAAPSPVSVAPGHVVVAPAQQAPAKVTPATVTAARDETERVREAHAIPPRLYRQLWDGKNRSPGDRAHKRMKRRRASGRR